MEQNYIEETQHKIAIIELNLSDEQYRKFLAQLNKATEITELNNVVQTFYNWAIK